MRDLEITKWIYDAAGTGRPEGDRSVRLPASGR
ncbi:MAG: hypothetical protein AVDCRST_MAG38-1991 [uncultured Solirubrobacteraceae bacterium]|uniref:Uncharacterized protein n=1 Tax=uncultured Solirubrobacteraceae bacterium TaxID=1162706 RepID=A0A6J4RWU7_9ACTN|nr:MAG: hypothetical protein AVDCRST_MAG38-1991 [uncultured Solirubrobacteraceae bacterium]